MRIWKKFRRRPRKDLLSEVVAILLAVKEKITDNSDVVWTNFNSAQEIREEIDRLINELKNENYKIVKEAYYNFLPTATFQEHSIQNG